MKMQIVDNFRYRRLYDPAHADIGVVIYPGETVVLYGRSNGRECCATIKTHLRVKRNMEHAIMELGPGGRIVKW